MRIITGYTGEAHITSADDQTLNFGRSGATRLDILSVGNRFSASAVGLNAIRIMDGAGYLYGVGFRVPAGTYDDVAIASCTSGYKRIDLICAHYARGGGGVESMSWRVVQGTETTGTPTDPDGLDSGIPWRGDNASDAAMFRVTVNGVSSVTVTPLFELSPNLRDLDASVQRISGCRVLLSEQIVSVSIPTIAAGAHGDEITYRVTLPTGADYFDAVPFDGGWIGTNSFGFSQSGKTVTFYPLNHGRSTINNGAFRFLLRFYKTI
jgi:hypothetical protein